MDIPYVRGRVALQAHVGVPEGTSRRSTPATASSAATPTSTAARAPVGWVSHRGPAQAAQPTTSARVDVSDGGGDLLRCEKARARQRRRAPLAHGLAHRADAVLLAATPTATRCFFVHEGRRAPRDRLRTAALRGRRLPLRAAGHALPPRAHLADALPHRGGFSESDLPRPKGMLGSTPSSTPLFCAFRRPKRAHPRGPTP
jgi:hypothetical protein